MTTKITTVKMLSGLLNDNPDCKNLRILITPKDAPQQGVGYSLVAPEGKLKFRRHFLQTSENSLAHSDPKNVVEIKFSRLLSAGLVKAANLMDTRIIRWLTTSQDPIDDYIIRLLPEFDIVVFTKKDT